MRDYYYLNWRFRLQLKELKQKNFWLKSEAKKVIYTDEKLRASDGLKSGAFFHETRVQSCNTNGNYK